MKNMLQAFKVALFCPEKRSSNRAAKMSKCHVMLHDRFNIQYGALFYAFREVYLLAHFRFQLSPGSLKLSESLDIFYLSERPELMY